MACGCKKKRGGAVFVPPTYATTITGGVFTMFGAHSHIIVATPSGKHELRAGHTTSLPLLEVESLIAQGAPIYLV